MIASLPMYDRAETAAANDALWDGIRSGLGHGPETLTRGGDLWDQWQSPDLAFSQTCGFPYRARLHGRVTLIGTPDYGLPGCPPGYYNSVFVARADDPRETLAGFTGAPFAFNEPLSQSGWAAPHTHAAGLGLTLTPALQSGGHLFSARAVAEGHADLAALDALSWKLMQRHDDFAGDLREITRTEPTPALPYIAALGAKRGALFAATTAAIDALDEAHRLALSLRGLVDIPAQDYLAVPTPPAPVLTPVSG